MIELYPRSIHDRYLKKICGSKGGIDAVCQEIKKACEGAGTNEKKLIELLGSKSLDDRSMIACRYKDMFKCDLHDLIASETSGSFGFLLELMSYPLPQAEAFAIKKALSGFGTREDMLIPVQTTHKLLSNNASHRVTNAFCRSSWVEPTMRLPF